MANATDTSATWFGESNKKYRYRVTRISARPTTNESGNYIFSKINPRGWWDAVYVGQGKLRDRYDAALQEGCVTKKNATHYHSHLNAWYSDRTEEESDIIKGNTECKHPRGCNGAPS